MSIYNESINEIRQSIDSIIGQTFSDFELIIVIDQPKYEDAQILLEWYSSKDSRIRYFVNKQNVGLALSMNFAAEHANGDYLLRMDADDICLKDRFQLQYDAIITGKYDLVCGNYQYIDEKGDEVDQKVTIYSDRQISMLLPIRNVIHHPTVIMRADKFHAVGGYRNYPCSQDYDLWLRMRNSGCTFHMLPNYLIYYRIRQNSITMRHKYKQYCTCEYIRNLYRNSKRGLHFSEEGYYAYLVANNVNSQLANDDYTLYKNKYLEAKCQIKKGSIINGFRSMLDIILNSRYFRPHILQGIYIILVTKFMK